MVPKVSGEEFRDDIVSSAHPLIKSIIELIPDKGYDTFRKQRVDGKEWLPCIREGECIHCDQRRWPTPEEVDAELAEDEKHMAKMLVGVAAVCEDAEKKGLRKGNGGVSEVACPVCDGGTIKYSVSNYNGHRHANCTTDGCVGFME
jgi:hypothetical protein